MYSLLRLQGAKLRLAEQKLLHLLRKFMTPKPENLFFIAAARVQCK